MRSPIDPAPLRSYLEKEKIASLDQLKQALRTTGTMTVFRKLSALGYLSSYSHRGKFYTLKEIPQFDEQGLWSWHSVWFSKYGNLIETAREFVEASKGGYTVPELEGLLHVECKAALLRLIERKLLEREMIDGLYVYWSKDAAKQRGQRLERSQHQQGMAYQGLAMADELKAAIVLFHSLLDEKQRRLYAGLEAYKLGHGGDQKIAQLFGIDRHTVAKGRRELLGGEVTTQRIREVGGGRKPQEKKRPKSSPGSKSF
jgi:hypothetical protein